MTRKEVIGELMTETEGNEVSLIDLLLILANRKRVLTIVPLVVGAIALAVAFAMPSLYRASVTLLPPQQSQSGAAALMAQMGA